MAERRDRARGEGEGPDAGPPAGLPEPRPSASARSVRGHDGRLRPYDPRRVEEAVRLVQAGAGESDPTFAREVSGIVGMTLESRFPSPRRRPPLRSGHLWSEPEADLFSYRTPTTDDVLDLVEETLVQMGRARVAKAFILDRDRRARARRALEVHGPRARVGEDVANGLDVDCGPIGTPWQRAAWSKERLARSLVTRGDLPLEIAEEVAERVEERFVLARFKRLTPGLIEAFIEAELLAMGFTDEAHRRSSFLLSRQAIREWILACSRQAPSAHLAAELLAPHAQSVLFEDVLPRAASEAIRAGVIFIEKAGRPLGPLVRTLPQSLVQEGQADLRLLGGLAPLFAGGGGELVLRELELAPQPDRGALRAMLEALQSAASAADSRLSLLDPLAGEGRLEALLPTLAQLGATRAGAPRLYLRERQLRELVQAGGAAREALDFLLACGGLVPVWDDDEERWLGPGVRRLPLHGGPDGLRTCVAAVCLNLPRLARRAGAWGEEDLFEQLVGGIEHAMEVVDALDELAGEAAARQSELSESRSYAITPVGFVEALRILSDGCAGAELGARVLALIDEATRRFSREHGRDVVLAPFFGRRAAAAFARADAGQRREQQVRLFSDLPTPEAAPALPYESGFPIAPEDFGPRGAEPGGDSGGGTAQGRRGDWCAEVYGRLRSGALFYQPAGGAQRTPITLDIWSRMASAQTSIRPHRPVAPGGLPAAEATLSAPTNPHEGLFRASGGRPA